MQPLLSDRPAVSGETAQPETVLVHEDRRALRVNLSGQSFDIGADRLRAGCRCALCTRARIDGTFAPALSGIEIEQVTPIGQYGLNLAFSDGHARGIFPFIYLAELADSQASPRST
jgi:DUF971 family protein